MHEWEAKCIWPNGDMEIVVVTTNFGKTVAHLLIQQLLKSDYEPGAEIMSIEKARPLFYYWSAG